MENKRIVGVQDMRIGKGPIIREEEEISCEMRLKLIREAQEKAYEAEEKKITEQYEAEGKSTEDLMADYAKYDLYKEYLVHMAVLTCDQATVEDFVLPMGQLVQLCDRKESRMQEKLEVDENPIHSNGLCYATDRDTIKWFNIPPFQCNCKRSQISREEMINILKDKDRHKFGVCRHLMKLEESWNNMPIAEEDYLEQTDAYLERIDSYPINGDSTVEYAERKSKGITMTSVLFCKQGGIIYPETSGQIRFMGEALAYMDLYLQGEVSETEIEKYIIYVSQNCELSIAKIVSGDFKGRDIEKDFDKYILAWSYYWNCKISEGTFGNGRIAIRPDVVKAMIMDESSWGTDTKLNGLNDVMQALVPGDYALWILSGYNPTLEDKSHFGNTEQVVWVVNEGDYMEASMRKEINYYYDHNKTITMTAYNGFGNGVGVLQKKVISIIDISEGQMPAELANCDGEYLIHYDAVTPNMSIACGIAYLAANIENTKSERKGVAAYNGGGAQAKTGESYVDKIDGHLKELGYDDGHAVKSLQ